MLRRFLLIRMSGMLRRGGVLMLLVELFRPIGTLEFMALTGNARQRDSHNQQGEKFHRRAS